MSRPAPSFAQFRSSFAPLAAGARPGCGATFRGASRRASFDAECGASNGESAAEALSA